MRSTKSGPGRWSCSLAIVWQRWLRSPSASLPSGGQLWLAQIRAMVALELRKALLGRRSLLVYGLASLPVLVMLMLMVVRRPGGDPVFEIGLPEARQRVVAARLERPTEHVQPFAHPREDRDTVSDFESDTSALTPTP